ncbi:hypothetical protein BD31_I0070 [Candidatus Nitrosopumilus salaria BD31]|uniref:Uncharacterized protein n=1 Tax=Candidatus Nitrosopumilus salarius BD31 TaxID=859350 RepID=I3D2G3_9ARCH|nr:hypothetical protein [Candidatus Nitrosopumilus salaria]EIJ65906.1 hypothetical protein BD31_I0070 [Candidatus Nitrosopumilus salaria BD31]
MGIDEAIRRLETSNQGLRGILDDIDTTLLGLRSDPRLDGLIDDLENLFNAYLKTWIKSNSEILDILKKI